VARLSRSGVAAATLARHNTAQILNASNSEIFYCPFSTGLNTDRQYQMSLSYTNDLYEAWQGCHAAACRLCHAAA